MLERHKDIRCMKHDSVRTYGRYSRDEEYDRAHVTVDGHTYYCNECADEIINKRMIRIERVDVKEVDDIRWVKQAKRDLIDLRRPQGDKMTFNQIFEVLDSCNFTTNGLGQHVRPGRNAVKRARREGRLTATKDHIIIVSSDPREHYTCRITRRTR